jgi:Fic family protein
MENATVAWDEPLTDARLCQWQAALFPAGDSALRRLEAGRYRSLSDPMQIVSGPIGRETVHYEAPPSSAVPAEMATFLAWFEESRHGTLDGVLRAGLAHVWFESIHPFDDGNGRVGRAIVDLALAQTARRATRLHGLSSGLERERDAYYAALNDAQRGTGDVTAWLAWFLTAVERACGRSLSVVDESLVRARFWSEHRELEMNERQRKVLDRMLDVGPGRFEGGLTTRKYVGMTGASPATASRDIADLVAKGLLAPGAAGGRSTYYDLAIRGWEWRPACRRPLASAVETQRAGISRGVHDPENLDAVASKPVVEHVTPHRSAADAGFGRDGGHREGVRDLAELNGTLLQHVEPLGGADQVAGADVRGDLHEVRHRDDREDDPTRRRFTGDFRRKSSLVTRSIAVPTSSTRPASASATPSAIAASSSAIRISRSWSNRTPARSTSLRELYRPRRTRTSTTLSRFLPRSTLLAMGGASEAGGEIMITVIRIGSHGSNDATGASRRPRAILRSSHGKCDTDSWPGSARFDGSRDDVERVQAHAHVRFAA